jgi:hypothetical protein
VLKEKYGAHLLISSSPRNIDVDFIHMHAAKGDFVFLSVFGQPILVLNSYKVVNDLFTKRFANYSDRPVTVLAGQM